MKNSEYWKGRSIQLEESLHQIGEDFYRDYAKQLEQTANEIQKDIESFYARFAKNNEISSDVAFRILSGEEKKRYQMSLEEYIAKGKTLPFTDEYIKELENASTAYRATRLQSLQLEMRKRADELMSYYDEGMKQAQSRIYSEGYYHNIFNIQQGIGFGTTFDALDDKIIDSVISKPWLPDGKNFSSRIWGDKRAALVNFLENDLTNAIIRGQDPQKVVKTLKDKFSVQKSDAAGLVYTEQAYFASAAQKDAYGALDLEEYQIVATLDAKTSEGCREMDGKVFPLSEYEPGRTAPPFHTYCRTVTAPYFEDEDGMRTARGADGKTYYVPSDMRYDEWYKEHVLKESRWRSIIGLETKDGIKIKEVKSHLLDQGSARKVTSEDAQGALVAPLHITETKFNTRSEPSVQYIGEKATVAINPDTGAIITTWKTGQGRIKKYKKEAEE